MLFRIWIVSMLIGAAGGLVAQTPPQVITRPLQVFWGGYRFNEQLADAGASQWTFVQQHMDGLILHGAYWNVSTASPSPDVLGPKLAALVNAQGKKVIVEHLLGGLYPDVDSAFGTAAAGNVSDAAGYGNGIKNIKRLMGYGFPQPDVSTDYIMAAWEQAVRFHPEWTKEEFFTALTGNWETYGGSLFNPAAGSADRTTYGWFRQWTERLAQAFPAIRVSSTNSPVYFTWTDGGDIHRELGGTLNNYHAWLKLERRGDAVSALYSGDGKGWAALGNATVPLGATPSAGMFVSSLNAARLAQGRFDSVAMVPFYFRDIGKTGRGGDFSVSGGTHTLVGYGNEFLHPGSNTSDAQFYAWQEVSGDAAFTVRLDSLVGSNAARTNPNGEHPTAGITLRESSAAGSRQVSLHANLANQLEFTARTATGGALANVVTPLNNLGVQSGARWLRLTRAGTTITAAHSADGTTWTTIGSTTVNFPAGLQAGLVADSQVRSETATAVFSNVSFFTPLTASFAGTNVGSAGATSSVSSGTYTLKAAGTGVAGAADALRLHSTAMTGDGTFLARLAYFADESSPSTALAAGAQLGVALRSDATTAGAAEVAVCFTPQLGLRMISRATAGASATEVATYGVGEVSVQPLGSVYRPLLHYFEGESFLGGLHESFPSTYAANHSGLTSDSPYAGYMRWGGSETHPDALRHREKIRLYEAWLQSQGREHHLIANSNVGGPTGTQAERDAWDLDYKQESMRSLQLHQLEGGRPDHVYLESWYDGPFTLVPETQNGTFTNLVRDALHYVKGVSQTLDLSVQPPGGGAFAGAGVLQSSPSGAQLVTAPTTAMGGAIAFTVRLTNSGTVPALPVLHAFETGGSGWTTSYTIGATNITAAITSGGGHAVTDAAMHSQNELIAAGASVDVTVTLTPAAATQRRQVLLRAFWNPQDPTLAVRDSVQITATPPAELIVNGGLEDGITGWTSNGGSVAAETTIVHSGSGAISSTRSQTYHGPAQDLLGRLVVGQSYRLSAWVRTSSATAATTKATFAYTGTSGGTIFTGMPTVQASNAGWTQITGYYRHTEPNGPATMLRLYFEGPPAGVVLYVDDVSLTLAEPTWTQAAPGAHTWSTSANWQSGFVPPSSSMTTLSFWSGVNLSTPGTVTAQHNLTSPFQTNALVLAGNGAAGASHELVLTGNALDLVAHDGTAPRIGLDASYGSAGGMICTVQNAIALSADVTASGNGTGDFVFTGVMSGGGSLAKSGSSTLTLRGNSTFTGGATLLAGMLELGSNNALGSGDLLISGGQVTAEMPGAFVLPNGIVFAADTTLWGALTFNGPSQLAGGNRALIVNTGAKTLNGVLSDDSPRTLTVTGNSTGSLVLGGDNTYRGATSINSGTLQITHGNGLGTASAGTTVAGGNALAALELAGGITSAEPLALIMHNSNGGHTQLRNVSGNNTLSGPISLNGGGSRWDIASLAGTLTITGSIANTVTSTDTWRALYLTGPGNGILSGALTDGGSGASKTNVTVLSGSWTLNGAGKTYTGGTLVYGSLRLDTTATSAINLQSGSMLSGTGSTGGTITVFNNVTVRRNLTNWTAPPAAIACSQLIASGTTAWVISLDATGMSNFAETARSIPVITTSGGLVNVSPAAISVQTTAFPGAGTWSVSTAGGAVTLNYTPPPYAVWSNTIAWNGADSAPGADPDRDGLQNLLEFVLNANPLANSSASLPTAQRSGSNLIFTFTRRDDSEPAATQIVQHSTNLSAWTDIPIGAASSGSVTVTENGASPDTVTVTLPVGANTRIFMRLRATSTP